MSNNEQLKKVDELQYIVLPGKMPKNFEYRTLYNRVFDFWEESWTKAFAQSGNPHGHWQDHFIRQDLVVALVTRSEVAACHLYTFYDLHSHSTLKSEYFHYVPESAVQHLMKEGRTHTMSMEYLCVGPSWKMNTEKVSLGKLMGSLGSHLAHERGAYGALGMPISGTRVDRMGENMGSTLLADKIKKFGYELSLVCIPTDTVSEGQDPVVRKLTTRLWQSRLDCTQYNVESLKHAA